MEVARVFQAVAKGAVDANMSSPDGGERQCERAVGCEPGGGQQGWYQRRMHAVIDESADARPRQIGREAHVRRQEEGAIEPPRMARQREGPCREAKERQSLRPEDQPWRPAHSAFGVYHPVFPMRRAFSSSYHQVERTPRSYFGLMAGRLNTSQ